MLTARSLSLPLPPGWEVLLGVDTGTYMSAAIVAVEPESTAAYVLEEIPNYRYVANELELLGLTIPVWAGQVVDAWHRYRPNQKAHAWADPNTQFRTELEHYGLYLRPNTKKLELRVEITREYQAADPPRLYLAPWLTVLPYEMEHAAWPEEHTTAGKFERVKQNDHTLDCVEHCLSRRPRSKRVRSGRKPTFLEQMMAAHGRPPVPRVADPHLGSL